MTGQTKRPLHLAILLRLMRSCSLPTCTLLSHLVGRDSGQYTEHLLTLLSAKPPQTPWAAIPSPSLEVSSEVSKHEDTSLRIASAAVQHIWTLFWLFYFILKDQCTACDRTIRNWQYDHHQQGLPQTNTWITRDGQPVSTKINILFSSLSPFHSKAAQHYRHSEFTIRMIVLQEKKKYNRKWNLEHSMILKHLCCQVIKQLNQVVGWARYLD